jgi:hypothetical protein
MFAALLALQAVLATPDARDAFAFLEPAVRVTTADRRRLDRGEPVARVLPDADRDVEIFAAIPVDIDGDRLAAWMRRIEALKKSPYVAAVGRFSDPPCIEDLADLALDGGDLQELRRCRPGECSARLSETEVDRVARAVAAAGPDWEAAVQGAFREIVLHRVQAYLSDGYAALEGYGKKERPVSLVRRVDPLAAHAPRFAEYLEKYPHAPMPEVESFVYWSKERLGGKPIVSATHVSILRPPKGTPRCSLPRRAFSPTTISTDRWR